MKKSRYRYLTIILILIAIFIFNNNDDNNDIKNTEESITETLEETNNQTKDNDTNINKEKADNKDEFSVINENESYYTKEDVSKYIYKYKKLPNNYIKKSEAKKIGWKPSKGNLWDVTDKKVIGGDTFGNREGNLPKGYKYFEADVNYNGGHRNAHRLVYTLDGPIVYYTGDHYKSFEVLYE